MFKRNLYKRMKFIQVLAMILFPFMNYYQLGFAETGSEYKTEGEEKLLLKIKEQNKEQFEAFKLSVNEEITKLKEMLPEKNATADEIREFTSQTATSLKDLEEKFGKLDELIKNNDYKAKLEELNDVLNKQGFEIKKLSQNKQSVSSAPTSKENFIKELIHKYVESDEYKEFAENGYRGAPPKFTMNPKGELVNAENINKGERLDILGKAVGIATDHTGSIFIAERNMNIRDFPIRNKNIRDLMNVGTTDSVQITAPEVYSYTDVVDGGSQMLAENAEVQDIGFKTKENTWTISRIAASLPLSERYIKTNGLNWVVSYLSQRLPRFIRVKEDFQFLFGDGSGNNVNGFTKDAQTLTLERATYVATDFSTVAGWNSNTQSLVTFSAAHGMKNGDNLTIANATNAGYNTTHVSVQVVNATQVIINEAYVAEAAGLVAAWTGYARSKWYQSIDSAQLFDVISVAKSELNTAEYSATGAVLSPADFDELGLIKGTDNHYVGISRDAYGNANINGLAIAVTTAMPAGQYLVGDFDMAVALFDYTPLTLYASKDTTDAKKNQVTWIIEEEFILAKYNPYWFMYGFIEVDKAKLETP